MTHRPPPHPDRSASDPSALSGLSASLLAAEREVLPAPPGARDRVWSRVEGTLAAPPLTAPPAAAWHSALWVKGALAALVVTGAVTAFLATREDAAAPGPTATAPTPGSAATDPPPGSTAAAPTTPPATTSIAAPSTPSSPTPSAAPDPAIVQKNGTMTAPINEEPVQNKDAATAPPTTVQSSGTIPLGPIAEPAPGASNTPRLPLGPKAPTVDPVAERALLDQAQAALRARRLRDVFLALDQHAQRFPRGALTEEREALRIRGLVEAGDRDAARGRAERFRRRYPKSLYGPSLGALGL